MVLVSSGVNCNPTHFQKGDDVLIWVTALCLHSVQCLVNSRSWLQSKAFLRCSFSTIASILLIVLEVDYSPKHFFFKVEGVLIRDSTVLFFITLLLFPSVLFIVLINSLSWLQSKDISENFTGFVCLLYGIIVCLRLVLCSCGNSYPEYWRDRFSFKKFENVQTSFIYRWEFLPRILEYWSDRFSHIIYECAKLLIGNLLF